MPPSTDEKLLHLLDDLVVHCANKERGCAWQGARRDLTRHLASSDECKAARADFAEKQQQTTAQPQEHPPPEDRLPDNAHIHGIASGVAESGLSRPAAAASKVRAMGRCCDTC